MFGGRIANADRLDKLVMKIECEKRNRQGSEVCLEDGCNTANVSKPISITQVERAVIASFKHLRDSLRL